jgi:hypothetical protein
MPHPVRELLRPGTGNAARIWRVALLAQSHRDDRNSPPIYRWDQNAQELISPLGTAEWVVVLWCKFSSAPLGLAELWQVNPAINRWAMVDRPCGTGTGHVASNPSALPGTGALRIAGLEWKRQGRHKQVSRVTHSNSAFAIIA